jgi:integrase
MSHLYRRHTADCTGNHPQRSFTSESDERKPRFKRCACPIVTRGTFGKPPRYRVVVTGHIDWDKARLAATRIEQGLAPVEIELKSDKPVEILPPAGEHMVLWRAIGLWLKRPRARDLAESSMVKYRTFAGQLYAFAQSRGYYFVDQFQPTDIDEFYASWTDGKSSKGKKLERMNGFFDFCKRRKWIAENPAEDLQAPAGYSIPNQKTPFTDEQLNRIEAAAAQWKDQKWHNGGESGIITAEDVVSFVMLLTETGLAITDAATFHMDRIDSRTQECTIRRTKTGAKVNTWITDELYSHLKALAFKRGHQPFMTQSCDPQQASDAWRERLRKVFRTAGSFPFHPTPHLFRHTFVRIHLQNGVSIEDVAALIGDTPETVRKWYSDWVPERQERLSRAVREAHERTRQRRRLAPVLSMLKKA